MNVGHIVKGTVNNILDKEKDLFTERMKICKKCKLFLADGLVGPRCNSSLYLNPETDEVSKIPKLGFKKGCGCILSSKTRVKETSCPLKKW